MNREKRRPTLEQLRAMPTELLHYELAQIAADAVDLSGIPVDMAILEIGGEAMNLIHNPDLTPEQVVALRERLMRATGSTAAEEPAA